MMTMRWCVFVNLSVLCSGRCSQEELRAAVRKIDPNKSPEDVDALIRLGLMIEKHKDVVTEELDEDGESERSIRICSFSASAAAHQPEWTLPTAVCISMRIMLSGAGGCANMLLLAAAAGNVVSTKTERVVVERKLIHRLQELPHEALEFQTNE